MLHIQTEQKNHHHHHHPSRPQPNGLSLMSKRGVARIDFRILNSEGVVTPHIESLSNDLLTMSLSNTSGTTMTDLQVDIMVIMEEVKDTIEENHFSQLTATELETILQKLESLRQQLRRRSLHIGTTELPISQTLDSIKEFIVSAKDFKVKMRLRDDKMRQHATSQSERSIAFLTDHIRRQMNELTEVFQRNVKNADSEELLRWRADLPTYVKKFYKIADNYKEVLRSPIRDADKLFDIKTIEEQYENLSDLKQVFAKSLDEEIEDQEIDKTRRFNKAQLNIKLDRFGGYDSNTDFYTFKTNFEKLHLQSTPRKLLPDLLKNNYLAEPALTLIETLDDIDTIWTRLKDAYGDAKVMLSRKLHEISKHDLIKTTNAEKLTTELGKVINMMLDTGKLAKDHHIEEHIYYGDGFTRICHLIGDRRTTKFLGSTCDDEPSPKEMWYKLVTFLEREKKVHQTKMRFDQSRSDTTNKDERKVASGNSRRFNTLTAHAVSTPYPSTSHGASGSKLQQGIITCQICGSKEGVADHISSPGPGGSRILQYFTCEQFVDASPATRLKLIKEKGFCFQCLLPGASSSYGKHAEGRCQRDFSCPHPSHDKYSTKKHVLVCEDHKTMECNKELLQKFTHRFIRSPMLPEFSKNINLSHHVEDCYKVTNEGCVDRGIYLLQEITVDNNKLLIFFDNGCSDFIVSRKAVQLLGSRATQKSSESIKLGGVGNTITKSSYGMYNIQLPLHDGIEVTLSGACLHQITAKFPIYPLTTAEKDIKHHYASSGGSNNLPSIPTSIGGEVHMMNWYQTLTIPPKNALPITFWIDNIPVILHKLIRRSWSHRRATSNILRDSSKSHLKY